MNKYDKNDKPVRIKIDSVFLDGILNIPDKDIGLVIFAHGSGSSRLSSRNMLVARTLQEKNIATLLFDLLTEKEDWSYEKRFDIDLLAKRLGLVTGWARKQPATKKFKVGYFGASTGSAAAIKAAVGDENRISAIVSRGGRVDLAAAEIADLKVSTLLIVGGNDPLVLEMNETAFDKIEADKKIEVVANATHLFEEKGALKQVANLAADWFLKYLK